MKFRTCMTDATRNAGGAPPLSLSLSLSPHTHTHAYTHTHTHTHAHTLTTKSAAQAAAYRAFKRSRAIGTRSVSPLHSRESAWADTEGGADPKPQISNPSSRHGDWCRVWGVGFGLWCRVRSVGFGTRYVSSLHSRESAWADTEGGADPRTCTLTSEPQTPNPKPQTPNPKPKTPNPTPHNPHPTPQTPNL